MFDWIGDALSWVGDKFSDVGTAISEAVWDVMLEWLFNTIYGAVAEFFGMMNGMGADIFSQSWVSAFLQLFSLFGWTLFAAGLVVAVFDTAIEYQTGRAKHSEYLSERVERLYGGQLVHESSSGDVQVLHHAANYIFRRSNRFIYRCNSRRFRHNGRSGAKKYGRIFRVIRTADHDCAGLLCGKAILCQHQAGRYFAVPDCGGKSVYVLPSKRIFRRFQRLV